jgi:hypothetical protein
VIAGVLAYSGMDVTNGRDPVVFLHPRFRGELPAELLQLEVRTLTERGPHARPASVHGLSSRIAAASAGR